MRSPHDPSTSNRSRSRVPGGWGARERGATPHQLAIEAEVAFSGHN